MNNFEDIYYEYLSNKLVFQTNLKRKEILAEYYEKLSLAKSRSYDRAQSIYEKAAEDCRDESYKAIDSFFSYKLSLLSRLRSQDCMAYTVHDIYDLILNNDIEDSELDLILSKLGKVLYSAETGP